MMADLPTDATAAQIEALVEKLYQAKRELEMQPCGMEPAQVSSHNNPHFVLIAKDESLRLLFENRLFQYFGKRYGVSLEEMLVHKPHWDGHPHTHSSTFCFPNGVTITVINL